MIPLSGDIENSKGIINKKIESNSISLGTSTLKRGLAHMLKNGVVMDVTTVEQAQIAEEAGAVSVMVLDKLPSDVRKAGGVARTASIRIIQEIMDTVTIPVPGSPLVLIIAAPSSILLSASASERAPLTNGVVKSHFQI